MPVIIAFVDTCRFGQSGNIGLRKEALVFVAAFDILGNQNRILGMFGEYLFQVKFIQAFPDDMRQERNASVFESLHDVIHILFAAAMIAVEHFIGNMMESASVIADEVFGGHG